ncbi:hypothetical protein [Massilia sp. TS11]|uniref:hypothetical protein n=1 Tax=Massilia sp. TS11 TaxID=2908003 RepID=UPI001EDC6B54|nr:hypothetical protein [Massilia sp. TS11]MCG2585984.1 hypothetical protein [Massilia sp. TS11]
MKRRQSQSSRQVDDILINDFSLDFLESLKPSVDISQELVRIAGKRDPVELDKEQLIELCKFGRPVAIHRPTGGAKIIVLCDDFAQRLVIVKSGDGPYFAFLP